MRVISGIFTVLMLAFLVLGCGGGEEQPEQVEESAEGAMEEMVDTAATMTDTMTQMIDSTAEMIEEAGQEHMGGE